MSAESQLIGAVLDAVGWSPKARERERQRIDEDYNSVYEALKSGQSIKEQGRTAQWIADRFDEDRAATLLGYEKTPSFQQAAQTRSTNTQLRQALDLMFGAPVDAGPYSGFEGPSFEGGRAPGPADYAERIANMSAQPGGEALLTTYFGDAPLAAGRARDQLTFQQGPQHDLDVRGMQVNERNAATNEGNLGARQAELEESVRQFDNRMVADLDAKNRDRVASMTDRVLAWNPTLDSRAARTIARVHAGELNPMVLAKRKTKDGRKLDEVIGLVSRGRAGSTGLPLSALYTRRNEIRDRVPNYIKSLSKSAKTQAQIDQTTLDSENTGALIQAIENAMEIQGALSSATGQPLDLESVINEVLLNSSFALSDGSKVQALPYTGLAPEQQQARRAQVETLIMDRFGGARGGGGAVSPAGEAVFGAWATGGAAPSAPAGADWQTGTGRIGGSPMTARGASPVPTPGATADRGGINPYTGQPGGYIYEPPIPVPPPRR